MAVRAIVLAAAVAAAHTLGPDDVIAQITAETTRAGVESAVRDAKVARLLLVRVGPVWDHLAVARRIELAEEWQDLWRHAIPQGIVAVLDARTDRPVVNYDAAGRARVATSAPTAPR